MSDIKFDWGIEPGTLDLRLDGPDISTRSFEKPPTFIMGGTETTFQIPTPPPLQMRITQSEPRQLRIPPRVLEIAKAHTPEGQGYISHYEMLYAALEYLCELEERKS